MENWQQNCTKSNEIGVIPYQRKGRWKKDWRRDYWQTGTWLKFIFSSSSFPWGICLSGGWSFSTILFKQRKVLAPKKGEAPWVLANTRTIIETVIGKQPGEGSDRQGAELEWPSFNVEGSSSCLSKGLASKRLLIEPESADVRSCRSWTWRGRS